MRDLLVPNQNVDGQVMQAPKKYSSEKTGPANSCRQGRVQLLPVNLAFGAIELEPKEAGNLMIVGECAMALFHDDAANSVPFKNSQQSVF